MRRPRLLLLAGLLPLAACTSFAAPGTAASTSPSSSSAAPSGTGELAVTDETDLGTPADTVTAARVVVGADGEVSTLLVGAQTASVRTGDASTSVSGTVLSDLVATATGPVGITLTAAAVPADPVLGVLPFGTAGTPNGDGVSPAPVPLSPEQTAPRGLPVYAAPSPDGDVLYVLAESTDGVGAVVVAVDPATGALQDSAAVDTGFADVTALALSGLVVTADGDLVVGLSLDSTDDRAAGGTASPLLRLDADLRPSGRVVDAQPGRQRAPLLALATDDRGEPVALVADPEAGLSLVRPDLDTGTSSTSPVAGPDAGDRAGSLAFADGTAVAGVLDQDSPTVAVARGEDDPVLLALCDEGAGDALAVTAGPAEGTFLVAGTCAGTTRLWTLG